MLEARGKKCESRLNCGAPQISTLGDEGMFGEMYAQLMKINERPVPFQYVTAEELWNDEHTSSRMLACHLDGSVDISSRKTTFIDRSVEFIVSYFGLDENKRVADFGCGPGLYTTRLARSGAEVTGIDFSKRSIRYARDQSARLGLQIEHIHADYLDFETSRRFDLITLIMCDFCALGPERRKRLLGRMRSLLKPGGRILLDVYSLRAFEKRPEQTFYAPDLMDGFWSKEPYFGFLNTFKYEQARVVLDKYTIVDKTKTRTIYNWLQYFDTDSLRREIEDCGLVVEEILANVAGDVFAPESDEFAVVVTNPKNAGEDP